MTVRFSTRCPNSNYLAFETSPEAIVAAAKKAEEVGFDAIFVNDHIIVDSSPRPAPWTNVYDPFVAAAWAVATPATTSAAAAKRVFMSILAIPADKEYMHLYGVGTLISRGVHRPDAARC